jgi:hypothetical protein
MNWSKEWGKIQAQRDSGWGNPVFVGIDTGKEDSKSIEGIVSKEGCYPILDSVPAGDGDEIEIQIPSYDNETNERIEDAFVIACVIVVGNLGVVINKEIDGRIYHLPTMTKFDTALPEREPGTRFSRKMLVAWCRKVQDEGPQESWQAINALTHETHRTDAKIARAALQEYCRSVPMNKE